MRCHTSSYTRKSSPRSSPRSSSGDRNLSPAGLIASCASWAFLAFFVYDRGAADRYSGPNFASMARAAALSAVSDSVVLSVRM